MKDVLLGGAKRVRREDQDRVRAGGRRFPVDRALVERIDHPDESVELVEKAPTE